MERKWWKEAVAYEIYVRSFRDADGDGTGDLRGVIGKLDYLRSLGVDLLWLTPTFPSPWRDSGYDVADYGAVHPVLGTMADMEGLLSSAHRRGLRVLLDLVINHTSDEHPWFRESRSSRDNPKRDWYLWRPGRDGGPPNNWASLAGGPAWELDPATGEYYLHLFSRYQPDLNWANPGVKSAIFATMRTWLERGVDGFRMDVINSLMKPPGLPDARPGPGVEARGPSLLDRRLYADNPGMHELLRAMRREVLAPYGAIAVGEVHFNTKDQCLLYVDPEREELDMVFQEDILFDRKGLPSVLRAIGAWEGAMLGKGWNGFSMGNHDTPRQVSALGDDGRFREAAAKLLATVALTAPGTPFIYQGDELGMANVSFPSLEDYRDIEMRNFFRERVEGGTDPAVALAALRPGSRDNARTPMQWDGGPDAGFGSARPWIGFNPDHGRVNAAAQENDPDSVLNHYRRLVAFRKAHLGLVYGSYELVSEGGESRPCVYRRSLPEETLVVALNPSPVPVDAPADPAMAREGLLGNYPWDAESPQRLRPWEARIHRV